MQENRAQSSCGNSEISGPVNIKTSGILAAGGDNSDFDVEAKAAPVGRPAIAATIKFAAESHEYVREYIRNADQKAIFYFSVCSALLAFEHTQNWGYRWMKSPSVWTAADLVTFVAMITLALAASLFLWTVLPRLGGSPRGVIFFKAIVGFNNVDDYVADVVRRPETDLATEKLRHCFELAKVASRKYDVLNAGLLCGAVGILCSLLLFVVVPPAERSAPGTQASIAR